MIIVSQDKERTTESMELFIDRIIGDDEPTIYKIYVDKSNAYLNLGIYKTKERAKKILAKINYWNAQFELFKVVSEKEQERMLDYFNRNNIDFNIYEMPKE